LGWPVVDVVAEGCPRVHLLVVDGDHDFIVSARENCVGKERLVIDAHVRERVAWKEKSRRGSGIDKRELLAPELLDRIDARVGAYDELRTVGLTALSKRREQHLGAVLVVRQN